MQKCAVWELMHIMQVNSIRRGEYGMILLIVCVVIAAVLFLVWGVKQNKFGKYYWCYAIAFGLTILTCFIHVHQMYHWTVIFVDIIAALTWGIAGIVGHRQNRMG